MSIVNRDTLNRIKEQRQSALNAHGYDLGYQRAMRALDAAIAQLEQIDKVTGDFSVELVKK